MEIILIILGMFTASIIWFIIELKNAPDFDEDKELGKRDSGTEA